MAMSSKERLLKIIEQLPDDTPLDDLIQHLTDLHPNANARPSAELMATDTDPGSTDEPSQIPVDFHLERRGRFTVLVPNRPVPSLPATFVNDILEEMRREREDRWLGLTDQDGG